ncbi:MAG: restriction endonuclease subunit S, partial [Sphaerospermopsis kisseleviana]
VMSKIDARYGAFGIAGDDVDGAIITGNFWAYDINHSLTTAEWINQYTNSPAFYDLCERASSGITHRRYLNEQIFLNHELFIPSLDEQSEILLLNNPDIKLTTPSCSGTV